MKKFKNLAGFVLKANTPGQARTLIAMGFKDVTFTPMRPQKLFKDTVWRKITKGFGLAGKTFAKDDVIEISVKDDGFYFIKAQNSQPVFATWCRKEWLDSHTVDYK